MLCYFPFFWVTTEKKKTFPQFFCSSLILVHVTLIFPVPPPPFCASNLFLLAAS